MSALRIILIALTLIPLTAHAGLFDDLGTTLRGDAKNETAAKPDPDTPNPDTPNRNLAVTQTNNATSDKRIALVIGNSAYTDSPLKNPKNDAKDMAKKLRGLGFDVIERTNLKTKQIGATLREFRSKLAPGAIALVFYAGHGLQINGENYLPTVDAEINAKEDVSNQSLSVRQIMDVLDESKTRLNLVFLDACRNNPYAARGFRSADKGLARVTAPSGTLISYATKPGSVAADGDGRNGLYTGKLLTQMDSNQQIEQTLKQVVTAVKAASQGKQEPWMEGSIEGDFCFGGCAAGSGTQLASLVPVPAREKTKGEIEDDYWDDIKDSNDLSSFEKYSKAYPEGRYLNPASHKIDQLKKKAQDALPVTPPPVVVQAPAQAKTKDQIEDDTWNAAEAANTAGAINAYLSGYPKGRYATQARIKLDTLKTAPAKPAEPVTPPGRQDNETALWNEVKNSSNKDDFDAYLSQYPKGKYIALAKSRIKKLQDEIAAEAVRKEQQTWQSAEQAGNETNYQSYLKDYPQGNYAGLAQVRIRKLQTDQAAREQQQLWQQAQASDNAQTVQRYLDKYPDSSHAPAAREKLEAIKKAEADLAARQEQALWNKADSGNDKAAVEAYLNKYPSGRYLTAASAKLQAIREEEAKGPAMVRIPGRNYEMGKYEITQKEWREVMGSNPSKFSNCGDTCPVEQVSWDDIQTYLQKLNQKTGRQYRLPTEAEWEYACYGGSQTEYCGGNIDSVAWYIGNSNQTTHPAGQKQANGYGLYDMSGNVWEWMENWYDSSKTEYGRALRGGSWDIIPQLARAADRGSIGAAYRGSFIGFRLARTLP